MLGSEAPQTCRKGLTEGTWTAMREVREDGRGRRPSTHLAGSEAPAAWHEDSGPGGLQTGLVAQVMTSLLQAYYLICPLVMARFLK